MNLGLRINVIISFICGINHQHSNSSDVRDTDFGDKTTPMELPSWLRLTLVIAL